MRLFALALVTLVLAACATAGGDGHADDDGDDDVAQPDAGLGSADADPGRPDGGGGSTDDPFHCELTVDSQFGAPEAAAGFPAVAGISVSDDLLEIVFTNGSDLFHGTRGGVGEAFSSSGAADIQDALWGSELALSGDGSTIAFAGRKLPTDTDRLFIAPTAQVASTSSWTQLDGPTDPKGIRTVGFAANGDLYVLEDRGAGHQLYRLSRSGGSITRTFHAVQGVASLAYAVISADEKTLYYRATSGGGLLRARRNNRDVVFVPAPATDLPLDGGSISWIPQWLSPRGCGLLVRRLGGGAPELHWLLMPV
jgi:hypothetical protein